MNSERLEQVVARRPRTLSFEFFPPKTEQAWLLFRDTVDQLATLGPDFMTCTYGAGGSTRDRTREAVSHIMHATGLPAVAHLTCVGATRDQLRELFDEYHEAGIVNFLALRGDPPRGQTRFTAVDGGCRYASELLELIREDGRFGMACAAFPEGHPESDAREEDWRWLLVKFEAGACLAMTQMFFSAEPYLAMMDWLARRDGSLPRVVPGVMPVRSWPWLVDFTSRFCPNAALPEALRERLEPLSDDPIASRKEGMAYTVELCRELLRAGAPGLHVYTLNKPMATAELVTALRLDGLLD